MYAASGDSAAVPRNDAFQLGEDERQSVKESWEKIIRWSRLNQMCVRGRPRFLSSSPVLFYSDTPPAERSLCCMPCRNGRNSACRARLPRLEPSAAPVPELRM